MPEHLQSGNADKSLTHAGYRSFDYRGARQYFDYGTRRLSINWHAPFDPLRGGLAEMEFPGGTAYVPPARDPGSWLVPVGTWEHLAVLRAREDRESRGAGTEPSPEPGENEPVVLAESFQLLQQWVGSVVGVHGEEFEAELRDVTEPSNADEVATFDVADVGPGERELLVPGAIFYWTLGYRTRSGSRERVSRIMFRRSPKWVARDVAAARQNGASLRRLLNERR